MSGARSLPFTRLGVLPEVWVDVPDAPSPSRPSTLKAGTTIHVLENGRYREVLESRAFPTWKAASIHAMINEARLSDATLAELARVGRVLGRARGYDAESGSADRCASARGISATVGAKAGRTVLRRRLPGSACFCAVWPQRKYDAEVAGKLAELLDAIAVPERLAEVGDWIIDCADGEDLLARLSGGEPTRG